MSIDRLPSGKWRVRWRDSTGRQRSRAFTARRDAERHETQVRRAKETGRIDTLEADRQTLAALAAEHMSAERARLSDRTAATYRALWAAHIDERVLGKHERQWAHAIASMTLPELRPEVIERWRDDRLAGGAGPHSIRKTMALMQAIFDRAVKFERIDRNPVKLVSKPRGQRAGRIDVIAPEGVERIRAELDEMGAMLVAVIAYAGVRPGEALRLRWRDVGQRTIYVYATKTDAAREDVRLVKPLKDDLTAWRGQCGNPPDDALVFPRADGSEWTDADWRNWRSRKFVPAARRAGIKITRPYDLRHSAASLWLHEGTNPVQVAAWLGNSPAITYGTYAHVIGELNQRQRRSAATVIAKARATVAGDTSATHPGVKGRQRLARAAA